MEETLNREVREAEADPGRRGNKIENKKKRKQRRKNNLLKKKSKKSNLKSKPKRTRQGRKMRERKRNGKKIKKSEGRRNKSKGQKKRKWNIQDWKTRKTRNKKGKRPKDKKRSKQKKTNKLRRNKKTKTNKENKEKTNKTMSSRQLAGWDGPSADVGPVTAGTGQYFSCNFFWYTRDQSLSRTQVQMGNRIIRFVKVMETNSANAATAFTEIIDALDFSTNGGTSCPGHPEALELLKTLKECPKTVPTICDVAAIPLYTEEVKSNLILTDPNSCLSQSTNYGKAYKDCLFKNSKKDHTTVCGCLEDGATAKPPSRPPCLPNFFDKVSKEVTDQKKKCDIGNPDNPSFTPGSWGDCKKASQSAVQYVVGGTNNCMGGGPLTTVAPTNRRMRLNQHFMKFAGLKQD